MSPDSHCRLRAKVARRGVGKPRFQPRRLCALHVVGLGCDSGLFRGFS